MNNFINIFCKKKDNFRFPPDPNGFIHLGHCFSLFLNKNFSLLYNGNFFLRFDNTNLKNNLNFFYKCIKYDILWLGIKWNNKINFFFNLISFFLKNLFFLIKKKIIYFKKKNIIVRFYTNLINYKKIFDLFCFKNSFYKKFDFSFFIKKKIIFRKTDKKRHWFIFPTYDFSQSINDYFNYISLSLCTLEFKKNSKIYNYIIKKNKTPIQIEFSRKNINKEKISKKKLLVFFFNIFYLKKIGLNPKNIYFICNNIGISKNNSLIKKNELKKIVKVEINYIYKNFFKKNFFCLNLKTKIFLSVFLNNKNINLNLYNYKFNFLNKNIYFNKKIIYKKSILLKTIIFIKKNNNFINNKYFKNKNHFFLKNNLLYKKTLINNVN